jgi:hypothetical protein
VQSFSKIENAHAPSKPFANADAAMVRKFKSKLPLLKYRQNWGLRAFVDLVNQRRLVLWLWQNVFLFSN